MLVRKPKTDKKHTGIGLPGVNTNTCRIEAAFLLALAALATAALRKDGVACGNSQFHRAGVVFIDISYWPQAVAFCLNLLLDRLSMFFLYFREFSCKTCQNFEAFDGFKRMFLHQSLGGNHPIWLHKLYRSRSLPLWIGMLNPYRLPAATVDRFRAWIVVYGSGTS